MGKVCMDQFMVDVTEIPEAEELDEVTLLGKDGTGLHYHGRIRRACQADLIMSSPAVSVKEFQEYIIKTDK